MSAIAEYDRLINNKWRDAGMLFAPDRMPTDKQAMQGCRALYRKAMGQPWRGRVRVAGKKNEHTWARGGVLIVNPRRAAPRGMGGWPDMVHSMAHYCHSVLRPHERPHSAHETLLETELTNYALSPAFAKYRV